jgi:MYXO-CTERM domain-containing protein
MCVSGACEGGETTPDDGCSCRAAGGGRGGDGALALLGLALLGIALRRLR